MIEIAELRAGVQITSHRIAAAAAAAEMSKLGGADAAAGPSPLRSRGGEQT